ncbi:MAG: electron transport complex subunit RsxG [Thiogranum sp.]|nr:electron transport complex subunit RsxG [Thiogranum sp.]
MSYRSILISAGFLFLFAVLGTGLVAYTYDTTAERIANNERRALLRKLNEVVDTDSYDNDIFNDVILVQSPLLGTRAPVPVYRARQDGWPVAAVLSPVAPDGYNGAIRLLVGINLDGTVTGVRVLRHQETPGLGDAIEAERSDWIRRFTGKSLNNPDLDGWKVRRDSGEFDQFTGATITPRAVVKAVRNALIYFKANRHQLFAQDPEPEQETPS